MTVSASVPGMWSETNDESFWPYSLTRRWMVSGDGVLEAVARRGCVPIRECCSEISCFERDILLITFLPIELDEFLDRAEVRLFIFAGGCVFDVVQRKRVLAGGSHRRASTRRGALKSLGSVAVDVFLPQKFSTRRSLRHSTSASTRIEVIFCLASTLTDYCEWILFGRINRQSQLDGECNLNRGLFHSNIGSVPSCEVSTSTSLR